MIARIAGLILLGVLLAGCSAPALFGPSTGTVVGNVSVRACGGPVRPDETGCPSRPLPGARISFQSNGSTVIATTESNGAYRIDLRPGSYTTQIDAEAFSRVVGPRQVTVTAGKTITADFTYVVQLL